MDKDEWKQILAEQAGVVRAEAAVSALGRGAVRARLDGGRWQRLHGRVLTTFSGSPNPEQRRWAAVLHGGTGAVTRNRADCRPSSPRRPPGIGHSGRMGGRRPGILRRTAIRSR
jgi:hypothetical protein